MRNVITILLLLITCLPASAGENDTIKVYFNLGVPTLNRAAMQQLDSLAYYDILIPNKNYGIIGYADYLGSEESNVTLSQNRAEAVSKYLQGLGIKHENIATVTGRGEINRNMATGDGYPEDRRVDIVLGGFKEPVRPAAQTVPKSTAPKWSVFFEENTQAENSGLRLRPGQDSVIADLCKYIKKHNVNVYLMGYYFGKNENVALSVDRANYVEWRLQQCGIRPERIGAAGHGYKELPKGGKPGDLRKVDITISGNAPAVQPQKKPTQIDIANLKKDETITLDNIHFLPGSHKITSASEVALFHLYIVMKDHPNLKIRLEGHICCLTNTTHDGYDYDTQEYRLSENRAKAVYDYLVSKGIDKERMEYKGFGISEPLAWHERSLADENKNRRVEIRVTDK